MKTKIVLYFIVWIACIYLYMYYRKNKHLRADPDCSGKNWTKIMASAIMSISGFAIQIIIGANWLWNYS